MRPQTESIAGCLVVLILLAIVVSAIGGSVKAGGLAAYWAGLSFWGKALLVGPLLVASPFLLLMVVGVIGSIVERLRRPREGPADSDHPEGPA